MLGKSAQEQTVPPTREFDFDWEGQKIHVYQWGKAENIPVVLLHGFMQTGLSWSIIGAVAIKLDIIGLAASAMPQEIKRVGAMIARKGGANDAPA